jgi:tRNA U34 5-carboxymethylaminomethyl modifying GTPase MnmE/TrmE
LLFDVVTKIRCAKENIKARSPLELSAEDLRNALQAIAELDGSGLAPEIMSTIFSRFCIGK